VTLTVMDAAGQTAEAAVTIEVSAEPDGGWETYCFSNDDDFSGCPSGSLTIRTSSWSGDAGDDVLDYAGHNRRLLLKKGHSFAYSGDCSPIGAGPQLIGAFGDGNNPVILFAGTRDHEWERSPTVAVGRDVRFSDIVFRLYSRNFGTIGGRDDNVLMLRITNENGIIGLRSAMFVVDSRLSNIYGNPAYAGGEKIVLMNSDLGPSHSHSVYGECQPGGIFTGNFFHDVANYGRTGIRLAANTCSSRNILVSNNRFDNLTWFAMQIVVTTTNYERYVESDIVIEKNHFSDCGGIMITREHGYSNISIRNNIFEISNGNRAIGLSNQVNYHPRWARGVRGLWVYNNLFYDYSSEYPTWLDSVVLDHADARDIVFENNIFTADGVGAVDGWIHALRVHPKVIRELRFRNNLYYYPDMQAGAFFYIDGVATGDLSWWQNYGGYGLDEGALVGDPLFVDPLNGDFRLQPSSPAIDGGSDIGFIYDDIHGVSRRAKGPPDIGPCEYSD
jgi:hypothetical protein